MQACNEEEASSSSKQPSNNEVVEPSGVGGSRRPKGTGRKKIEIKKIENKLSRKVAFSKRRKGLFKKAADICESCEAEIAIIVFSAKGRLFCYGYPSVEHVVDRFLDGNPEESYAVSPEEEEKEEEEEEEEEEEASLVGSDGGEFWFDESIEDLDMEKLEEYAINLVCLRDNLFMRLEELTMRRTCETDFLARFGL